MAEPGDRERRTREEPRLSGLAEAYRKAAPYTAASTSLVVAVGLFTWLGVKADEWLHSRPWLTLAGVALGMTGGFISFFKTVFWSNRRP